MARIHDLQRGRVPNGLPPGSLFFFDYPAIRVGITIVCQDMKRHSHMTLAFCTFDALRLYGGCGSLAFPDDFTMSTRLAVRMLVGSAKGHYKGPKGLKRPLRVL